MNLRNLLNLFVAHRVNDFERTVVYRLLKKAWCISSLMRATFATQQTQQARTDGGSKYWSGFTHQLRAGKCISQ